MDLGAGMLVKGQLPVPKWERAACREVLKMSIYLMGMYIFTVLMETGHISHSSLQQAGSTTTIFQPWF